MTILLSKPSKTARELSKMLEIPIFYDYIPQEADFVIRFGNTIESDFIGEELNTREAIMTASDKALARQILINNGIPTPTPSENDFPIIARKKHHYGGSGFFVCDDEFELQQAKERGAIYFSKYYPKTKEFRVHIGSGKALLVSIKEGEFDSYIWNKSNGFTFRHLRRGVWLENDDLRHIVRIAKQAVEVLGLDFGAVDVMAFPSDGQARAVVSEVNTAPSLSPLAMIKYAKYFLS